MADIIQQLPDSIANQIAAGEVIQRPASAVKELLENSIDSGASNIQLIIKDAGKALVHVIDDGCGMSDTDARMSFERHATSKIRKADDLFCIRSMGFRGEALASIAAIANLELKTRLHDEEIGTCIRIEASEVKVQEPCSATKGTSIAIKNLFFNIPARRNFLKSNPVETRHIIDEFQRVALANPQIAFNMHHNGIEVFHLPPENLRKRIINIFGANYNQRLVPVEESTPVVGIRGFVGKPEFCRKTRGEQYFFVNNRYIRSPYLNHAIINAFEDLIPSSSYPLYVLFLDIDPEKIDINIHPTKQEVKFEDEKIIYTYLHAAVKRALGKYSIAPTLDFDSDPSFEKYTAKPDPSFANRDFSKGWHPPGKEERMTGGEAWKEFMKTDKPENAGNAVITVESDWQEKNENNNLHENGKTDVKPVQIHQRFILTTIKDGMILIDQQAAHERVLFERYLTVLKDAKSMSQKSLFPQTIHLNVSDTQLLKEILPGITALGFDIQEFGTNDFVVHGMPPDLNSQNEQQVIEGLLEQYKVNRESLSGQLHENLAHSLAAEVSIKKGKFLTVAEMNILIDELFACKDFYKSPGGNLTFVKFSLQELEKQFEKKR
jgi:DNA mismatch repair protein MutL